MLHCHLKLPLLKFYRIIRKHFVHIFIAFTKAKTLDFRNQVFSHMIQNPIFALVNTSEPRPMNIVAVFWTNPTPLCLKSHDHNYSRKIFKNSPCSLCFTECVWSFCFFLFSFSKKMSLNSPARHHSNCLNTPRHRRIALGPRLSTKVSAVWDAHANWAQIKLLNWCHPHPIYFTTDEGQFCLSQSLQPAIIRGITNRASLQRTPWPVPALLASHSACVG